MVSLASIARLASTEQRVVDKSTHSEQRLRPISTMVGDRAFWIVTFTLVISYLLLWISNFHYVYGWITDDRTLFLKGIATIDDWKEAFTWHNADYNAHQPYFFLVSYLPLASGISLPSYPLPEFGEKTGNFRFFLLYAVSLHAALLLSWAWFVKYLTNNRLIALLSLLLFATSPTLILWSPQPESRLYGLPFIFAGYSMLLRLAHEKSSASRGQWRRTLLAGSLFGLAQSIHYTSFYLIAPLCLVFWLLWLPRRIKQATARLALYSFILGCIWLQLLMELISYFLVGLPIHQGPTITLLRLRFLHASNWSTLGNLQLWQEWFVSQMGLPLMLAIAIGWFLYLRQARSMDEPQRFTAILTGVTVALGLGYLGLGGAMPLFRQTSVLQPFLFFFASIAIVSLAQRITRWRTVQLGVLGASVVAVGFVPWTQAATVFQAHQGLGRALEWAYANKGDRRLEWLRIAWYEDTTSLTSLDELERVSPDTWLVAYFPWHFVQWHTSHLPYVDAAQPLARWPTLWGTDAVHAEFASYWPNTDWRHFPLMGEARVYEVKAITSLLKGKPLNVRSVVADSVATPDYEAVNVFDRESSPDGKTAWVSQDSAMPHWLEVRFQEPAPLSEVRVLLPPTHRRVSRIAALEVQAITETGTYRTVWHGDGLERQAMIAPRWEPMLATGLRFIVHRQTFPWADTNRAAIEEVVFPGYQIMPPRPERVFPELELQEVQARPSGLIVTGRNLTPHTRLVVGELVLPTRLLNDVQRPTWISVDTSSELGRLEAYLTGGVELPTGTAEVYLTDGFRRSNSYWLTVNQRN